MKLLRKIIRHKPIYCIRHNTGKERAKLDCSQNTQDKEATQYMQGRFTLALFCQ
jgi:hypothetical protein